MRKINIVGGSNNCSIVSKMLQENNLFPDEYEIIDYGKAKWFMKEDIVIFFGCHIIPLLKLITAKANTKIIRFTGTDYHGNFLHKFGIEYILPLFLDSIHVIYCDATLKEGVGIEGALLHSPVNENMFYNMKKKERIIDALVYVAKNEKLFCMNKAQQLKKVYSKVMIIRGDVPYNEMPSLYNNSKRYYRNVLNDASPKSIYEALICGCEVIYNGDKITEIPKHMLSSHEMPKWFIYIEEVSRV